MNTFISIGIPAILAISLVLMLNPIASSPSSYGQIIGQTNPTNQTNQTSGQNTTQQAQQQLDQANQQIQQAQQQKQQAEQQLQQANQTQQQSNQSSKQPDPQMNEKLLNYTNAAILALNEDNTSAAQDSLVQIQNALINASGKQVVVVPAPAVAPSSSDDDGDSE
ncbi:MAG TPA: hypothetical protein VJR94_08010 [Candidatus Nitrosocosmicus sp.]|nr:hypothetical protein [Candidatus Nitrosocosmicus sp.]